MSGPDDLELAALICSKVCHDLISPVGAIANGFEVLDEEQDEEMRKMALDIVRSNGAKASARLQFARMAFGAMGTSGDTVSLDEARRLTDALYEGEKVSVQWPDDSPDLPKNQVKLLVNLVTLAVQAIPRGGSVTVDLDGGFRLLSQGPRATIPAAVGGIFDGDLPAEGIDAHSVQFYYAARVARAVNMRVTLTSLDEETVEIRVTPAA